MNKSVVSTTIDSVLQLMQEDFREAEPRKRQIFLNGFNWEAGLLVSTAIAAVASSYLIPVDHYLAKYEGNLQLSLEPKEENASRSNSGNAQVEIPAISIDYETQARILWSPKLISPVIARLQKQYPDLSYDRLSHNLKITHPEGSRTLEISYKDTDTQRTRAVLEQLSQAYLKYSQESPGNNDSALQFVEKRVPELKREVAQIQEKMRQFQQQHGLADPDALGQQLAQQSNALTQQQQDLQSQLLEARTAYAVLEQRLAESFEQVPEHQSENQYKNQLLESQRLESQRLESQLLNQPNPDYQELLNQFQLTATQLTVERIRPESDLEANRAKQQALERQYQQLSEKLSQAIQQPLSERLAQINSGSSPENSQGANRLERLMELKVTDNQVRMLEISLGAIVQTKAQLGNRIKQWAGLARQYDQLQLELQITTNKLNLSLAKQAELQTFIQAAWQVIAPPQVKPMAENGFTLSDSQRDFGLALCFIVVVWAIMHRKNAGRSKKSIGSPLPELQPDHSSLMSQSSQPLALEIPKAKVLCLIDNDSNPLLNWHSSSLREVTKVSKKVR